MIYKIIGAAMIVIACGAVGFIMAVNHRREVQLLQCLLAAISYMRCELEYRHTPLPELCRKTAAICPNHIGRFFSALSQELESQICPDTRICSINALSKMKSFPDSVRNCILNFADTLGAFDLNGQLQGLDQTEQQAQRSLDKLIFEQDIRLRSYQTLGLCAGAAIAILLV